MAKTVPMGADDAGTLEYGFNSAGASQFPYNLRTSEHQAQRDLHLPRIAHGGSDRAHRAVADRRIRLAELRVIEHVERFGAELNGQSLQRTEVLEQRRIQVRAPRPEQNIASGVAVNVNCAGVVKAV